MKIVNIKIDFAPLFCLIVILSITKQCSSSSISVSEHRVEEKVSSEVNDLHLRKRSVLVKSPLKQQPNKVIKEKYPIEKRPSKSTPSPTPSPIKKIIKDKYPIEKWPPKSTSSPTSSPTPSPKVITLGDSYSSGTGIHRDGCDYDVEYGGNPSLYGQSYLFTGNGLDMCWMETDTTPGPRYASQMGLQSVFVACQGAQIEHIENQMDYVNALYPSDSANNWVGSTILLTAGGNDIQTVGGMSWPDLLIECILETSVFNGCHDENANQVGNWNTIQNDLTALFTKLAVEASGAKIRILGYPKMMQRDPGCGSVTGVSRNEADWIDDQCVSLNNNISSAVNNVLANYPNVDMEFVSVYNYLTVGACGNGPSNRHVHDKRLHSYFPWATSNSSFHPSQKGYDAYLNALIHSL